MTVEDRPLEAEHRERLVAMLQQAITTLPESRAQMTIWESWQNAVSDQKQMPEFLTLTYLWILPREERGAWERETGRMIHEVEVLRTVRDVVKQALQPGVPADWPEHPGAAARVIEWRRNGDLHGEVQLELREGPEGEKPWIWVPGNRLTLPWDAAPTQEPAGPSKV